MTKATTARIALVESPPPQVAPDSFSDAFREHYAFVTRLAIAFGVSVRAADDVAQEVFLIALRRWESYDGRASFRRWLSGITRRVAKDWRRSRQRYDRRLRLVAATRDAGDMTDDVERAQALTLVERFIGQIDERRRPVFVLSEVQGLTGPEIAEVLGLRLNTVYSRLRTARELFSKWVNAATGGNS